jgi:rare lipoprotein A
VSWFIPHAATSVVLTRLHLNPLAVTLLAGVVAVGAAGCKPLADPQASAAPKDEEPLPAAPGRPPTDLSGRTRFGDASFYAKKFTGREMADGSKMDPHGDNAASKTLPLGTTARVTNIETGESAVVTIQDRGPYVEGRIVDLSPSTAQKIGITEHNGVAQVAVAPISVPLPDGSTKRIATPAEKR